MGMLNKTFKDIQKKTQKAEPGTVENALFAATGIDYIDYVGGTINEDPEGNAFPNIGIPQGKITLFVGHSQSGKTTLAIQTAYNMVKDLGGDIILADFERSSNNVKDRVMNITGCTAEMFDETFTVFRSTNLTSEFIKDTLFKIAEEKEKAGKSCFVDYADSKGEPLEIYPPTVLIIDSVASMRTKELLENAALDGNMAAASIAKGNSSLLTSIIHLLERYNITILGI